MPLPWRRLSSAVVFLLAWIAAWLAWPQVGGQGHLDLMHWGWKLALPLGFAFAAAGFGNALLLARSWFSLRLLAWLLFAGAFVGAAGWVTYYYHLQEEPPAGESEEGLADARRVSLLPWHN